MRFTKFLTLAAVLASTWSALTTPSWADTAKKIAVFPLDMSAPKTQEDYFFGPRGPTPDEQRRLDISFADLKKRLTEDGRYSLVDITPVEKEMNDKRPFYHCNGCEVDLAAKLGAELVMVGYVDKISETHLRLNITILTVPESKFVSTDSVLMQGNTDESWLHGVKWITKNRILAKGK